MFHSPMPLRKRNHNPFIELECLLVRNKMLTVITNDVSMNVFSVELAKRKEHCHFVMTMDDNADPISRYQCTSQSQLNRWREL